MMKIGNVVKKLGIPASTIRYYEKVGLINHLARVGNSRYLHNEDLTQLKFIQMSQKVGFSIEEIKELLSAFSKDDVRNEKCQELVGKKIVELDKKILELTTMKNSLSKAINCDCSSIDVCVDYSDQVSTCFRN